jgi:hypothetical protein
VAIATMLACGDDGDSPAPSATGAQSDKGSVWGRRDAPPAGVRRQVEYFGVGDGVCGPTEPAVPTIMLDRRPFYQGQTMAEEIDRPELGETFSVCARGFNPTQPVRLKFLRPDASVIERLLPPSEDDLDRYVSFFLGADWPTGSHRITASQGSARVGLTVDVVEPRHWGVRAPIFVGRGELNPRPVMVVGRRPNTRVLVDIYRQGASGSLYRTSIAIRTDDRGLGERSLRVDASDEGNFVLTPRIPRDPEDQDERAWVHVCWTPPCG